MMDRWVEGSTGDGIAFLRLGGGARATESLVPLPGRRTVLDIWLRPRLREAALFFLIIAAMIAVTALIVHATGGTRNSPAHLAYVPIIIAALSFGIPGGVLAAAGAGLALGPLMPIDTASGEMQTTANWMARLGFFLLAGMVTGSGANLLKSVTGELRLAGYVDRETGLPNLASFRAVAPAILRDRRTEGLFVIHVTGFASVTAAFGYGSAVVFIRQVAARLEEVAEQADFIAPPFRVSEADFALVSARRPSPALSARLLNRLREPVMLSGVPVAPEPSLGHVGTADDGADAELLLRRAAAGAQDNHRSGRYAGAAEGAEREEDERRARLELLGQLHQALETPQIHLLYQPKIRLGDGGLDGCEALVRWRHPQRGNISPGMFVPLAEETGIMWSMTQAILRKALRQLAQWRRAGHPCVVAVNFSARDFLVPDMVKPIEATLRELDVPPDLIEIEITESALTGASDTMRANMHRLRDAGLRLAIDDYGVGASSLSYLKTIPATVLKIDQTFIRDIAADARDAAIVASTIELAHNLGLTVVAEGVEDRDTMARLADLGCDIAQGYHFDRPLPPEEFAGRYLNGGGAGQKSA